MNLTRLFIQRPIILVMIIAAVLLLGFRSWLDLPAELDPKVEIPVVNVVTVYPGAGPEEVEQRVARPLEEAVSSVGNVTRVSSRSLEGACFVTVRFKLGIDLNAAAADVRARVEAVRRELPNDIEPPQVVKFDFNARPVMVLGVTGDRPLQEIRSLVDEEIKPRLSQIPGIGGVEVVGGQRREIQVRVDPERLQLYGIGLLDVLRPLQAASQSAPAGDVVQGPRAVDVRVLGEFASLDDIRDTPIPVERPGAMRDPRGSGPTAPLRLGDLATVTDGQAERSQITRVGRRESVGVIISRLSDANSVQVAKSVRTELADLKKLLPAGTRITVLQDHSVAVADALDDINFTLLLGSLLAVLIVFLFLHSFKDTVIVACAIPISIVATFIVMYFAGFSLNQMTMLALSLSVGILVDDSILVLESIHRHRAMGKPPQDAALDGRAEIGLADAANTFVDVVVFLPIAFMGGVVGQFFREFGLTIASATLASLYVSFTLTPMLAARWFRPEEGVSEPNSRFARWFDRRYVRFEEGYRVFLAWALRHRLFVVCGGFGALTLVGFLAWQVLGFDFTPSIDRGQVTVNVRMPPGTSLAATDALVSRIEAAAAKIPEVDAGRILASTGEILGGFGSLPDRGPELGQLTLMLIEKQGFVDRLLHPFGQPGRRKRTDEDAARELRTRLHGVPGEEYVNVQAVRGMTSSLAPVEIGLYGNDLKTLERVAEACEERMARIPLLQNVESSQRRGTPEMQVVLDRERAGDLMVTSAEVAGTLRTSIAGNTDLRYREGTRSYPIRVMLRPGGPESPQGGLDAMRNVLVTHRGPMPVYVGDVADVRMGAGPTKILRSRRMRQAVLTASVREGVSLGEAEKAVNQALVDVDFRGVERVWLGDVDDMKDSAFTMAGALILAILLSYMLMAAVFNSPVYPLIIMSSVPMALVGGLLGLIYTGTTMNIVSMIGIVMLVGLVSKNAILLVDYTNTLRSRGLGRSAALEAAGPVRLRPIVMTTTSTVIAMTPVALQIGRGSELRAPMAIVVIGGLLLSTVLTLVIVPVMYTYFDDLAEGIQRAWRQAFGRSGAPPEARPGEPRPVGRERD